MEAATIQQIEEAYTAMADAPPEPEIRFETLEEFLEWPKPEDGFKYEWNDGLVVISVYLCTMLNAQIISNSIIICTRPHT